MYDVIVVGAGPAGSTAAKTLAENGYRVLLVEKFKMPRYKSCSGQLIEKTLTLVQAYFDEPVPASALCAPTENRGMIFTDDIGRTFRFEQKGLNVWRSTFDHWLATKAAQHGVEIREGTAAVSCSQRDGVVTVALKGENSYTQQARYVIDCEGVVGALKRKLTNAAPPYITTYQTFNQGSIDLDPHYFYAYLQPQLSEYDAWFNVKDHQLVLGVSVKNASHAEGCYARFTAYLKEKHCLQIDRQLKTDKWLMPFVRPGCPISLGVGQVFFAGEAAGFLNPMGEGISAAMESGRCAADAVMEHFNSPALACAAYRQRTAGLHRYMQRQWSLVAGMAAPFAEMK